MTTCFLLLYFTHICILSIDEIKIFFIIIIYELIADGWRIHVSEI